MAIQAAGALAGIGAALSAVTSAIGHQTRAAAPGAAARVDTSTSALALAKDRKHFRQLKKNADQERLLAVLTDPQILGLLVTFGGLAAATRIPFHPDPAVNARIQPLAGSAAVLMGLGRAGVGDLTTTAMAAAAGLALGLPAPGAGRDLLDYGTVKLPYTDVPLASIWGPIPSIRWAIDQVSRS